MTIGHGELRASVSYFGCEAVQGGGSCRERGARTQIVSGGAGRRACSCSLLSLRRLALLRPPNTGKTLRIADCKHGELLLLGYAESSAAAADGAAAQLGAAAAALQQPLLLYYCCCVARACSWRNSEKRR